MRGNSARSRSWWRSSCGLVSDNEQSSQYSPGSLRHLESQDADLKIGDTIELRDSRVLIDKRPVLNAVEIKRGDDALVLQDGDRSPR